MMLINKINSFFIRPSKEWKNDYLKMNKNISITDNNIYFYPTDHLNYLGAEKYLNKIINIINKKSKINKIEFIKSQPCIFEKSNDLSLQPDYFWSKPGIIDIYVGNSYNCNFFEKYIIQRMIFKLNEKYEFITKVLFENKNIYE